MATSSHAQAVKSLNNAGGRRRFVFKTFSDRINEIDISINVFRSLDKVKAEPSEGSSFFRDCLVEWRELNTAEDFISFYEEILPFVQTLPLVLLQKELIFSKLESRLQMKARLSLEPILRLIAALSRDLLDDFLPFLPRIVKALVFLLESGGEKEPEIVEQIFTSWSYTMMYLQKYLICDIEGLLRDTLELRYYPKDYIKEFMSESISFSLRKAPEEQLEKGIRRILFEVADPLRKNGGVALLYFIMRGASSSLHSKAEVVLRILLKDSTLSFPQGSTAAVEVVSSTLQRLCEDFEAKELSIIWKCLYSEIDESVKSKTFVHLSCLLAVLTSVVRIKKGCETSDNQPMRLVSCLMPTLLASSESMEEEGKLSGVLDGVLQLMLCIIDNLQTPNEMDTIAVQWAPVFALKSSSLLTFIRELLQRDHPIVETFSTNILSVINNLVDSSQSSEEVVYLLLLLCERQRTTTHVMETSDEISGRIHGFLEENMKKAVQDIVQGNIIFTKIDEGKLAALWGVINCYPYFKVDSSLLDHLVHALREHLPVSVVNITSALEMKWQSLFGAALSSYYKLHFPSKIKYGDVAEALSFAKKYNSCVQVLSAVAEYLDRPVLADDNRCMEYHLELRAEKAVEAFKIFSENLRHSNKDIRVMTLRILCHFEELNSEPANDEHPPKKKMKTEEIQASLPGSNVLRLLLFIEETPLTITSSRKLVNLITKIQMDLSAGRIHEAYVPLLFNGMMGVFHNRFSYLWDPTSECLAVLLKKHTGVIWDELVRYFGQCQLKFEIHNIPNESENRSLSDNSMDLVVHFNSFLSRPSDSTPNATVVSLLLRTLQKVPFVAESRSLYIIPLFLEFLGYNVEDLLRDLSASVGLFNRGACKGKEWKGALKEWLCLLKLMRNPRSFQHGQFVKDVLQYRLLDDNDAEIQMKALECLSLWKDDFFLPYYQHLKNLISSKDLREELTTWSLSKESKCIEEAHRAHLVSLVIRILMPKVRKLKTLASRKHTSMLHRKAVLCFISQLDVRELTIFFALLIKPLNISSEETIDLFWTSLDCSSEHFQMSNFLKCFTVESVSSLSWKKKFGFLHVIQHTLEVFDEFHIRPFLDFLMGCVVRLLVNSAGRNATDVSSDEEENVSLNHDQTGCTSKQFKELRSICLKIIALVLDKHEDCDLGSEFWDIFFVAVNQLIKSFKQEGSSSQKPSSLFSCFLSMSRSHKLVTLLCREKNLVPDIFSMLTVSRASEAVKTSVLKFIENLLSLDTELGGEDNMVKRILDTNTETLIQSLHSLFVGDTCKRNSNRYHGEREITIIELLSKYIEQSNAEKYLDVLLSFLAKSAKDSEIRRKALQIMQYIIPVLGTESTSKVLNIISPLLIDSELDTRLFICGLLKALAGIDPSLHLVARLVCDLNATSPMEVDGLDYDKIVNTYAEIDIDFFKKSSEQHTLILLSQCVYNMSSKEHMLRDGAYGLLRSFIAFSASVLRQNASGPSDINKKVGETYGNWTKAHILHIIRKFLLKHMGRSVIRGGSIRKEWIHLIREMVMELPDAGNLASFKALCSENAEVDFFKNIVHLQKHRVAKALMRFANVINTNSLHEGVVAKLFVSLFFNMLLEGQDGKDDNVRTACVEALASTSAHMKWESYYALLSRCFREMSKHTNKTKILLRLICSILDKFHFAKGGNKDEAEECSNDSLNGDTCLEITTCLQKSVFPKIQKLMNSDSDSVNVNINLAALKVLKLLPKEIMDAQLPAIVHRICSFLKNRLESTRDEARLALAACLKELGLEYLEFVIKILCAILKRGFELHVLGYTVNFILSKCLSNPLLCGKVDYCLKDLLAVVETDIFGDVAEQKEVEKIASKMKETRKCKSFETLKLMAQNVTFKSHVRMLLSPVTAQLQRHLTPKLKSKLENMLDHIAAGIEGNPTVVQRDLFLFIYELVDDSLNRERGTADQLISEASKKDKKDLPKKTNTAGFVSGAKSCSQLITVFALGLLHNRVKNTKQTEFNEELLEMLLPFVEKLAGCLSSKYEEVVSSTLRCFTALMRFLPDLISSGDKAKTLQIIEKVKITLLTIAQSAVDSSSPLMQSSLKLLTVLLRSEMITLSSEQLRMLFQFPMFVDLETDPSFVALSLLKAIVKKEHAVPEIYDIAIRVGELMVKSQLESIRKKCSQILLQFLVRYKLSENRLQQHVDFLLANLRYEHPSGREAVLEMLHAIIKKLSEPRLKKQSMALFVHLVGCLASDGDSVVRSQAGTVIKFLIGRINEDQVSAMLSCCLSWYSSKKQHLQAAAAQVLGFFIEVKKKGFQQYINAVLQKAETILRSAVSSASEQTQDTTEEAIIPFWKEAYYSLVMIEKMLHHFPGLSSEDDIKGIWNMVFELLRHPHAWLQNISCRLLHYYFSAFTMKRPSSQELAVDSLLTRPSRLFRVAVSLCIQLKEKPATVDTSIVDLLTANIVFAVSALHSSDGINHGKFWSTLEEDERRLFIEAFELIDLRKERSKFMALALGEQTGEGEEDANNPRKLFVGSLLKKMGKLALEMESVQMKAVLNVYKSFTSQMSQEECHLYASVILLPLYKICEGFAGKVISDELKQQAEEVRDGIRATLGTKMFEESYREIRKRLEAKRETRKREQKLMAVVNPVRNAKRKLRLAAKNRNNKRRRTMTFKMARFYH